MKIGIYSNPHKDKSGRHAKELCDLLDKYQAEYFLCVSEKFSLDCAGFVPDAVIAFGGDGTMLRAVSECAEKDIPILGVNLGKVGFLTEIGCENMREAAEKLLAGDDAADAAFYPLDALPEPLCFDHARIIAHFRDWKEGRRPLLPCAEDPSLEYGDIPYTRPF